MAKRLAKYPIDPAAPVEGGAGSFFDVSVTAVGSTGQLSVQTVLADVNEERNRCEGVFPCNYSDLTRFSEELERALASAEGDARLTSHVIERF